ncbi:MAG: rRNA adenine N(6)-methyltransferase family protein, partial [Thaumarchaeota archaeon]|nr:rRNA adenine N(6)-methyltransferase family protein [Nitrososphaerota archaeon]
MSSRRKGRRRALGQHYLTDRSVLDLMVERAEIQKGQRVLEVGTGRGVVTRELCDIASSVEGFELDAENYAATERLGLDGLTLRNEDAFSQPRDFDVLVSSLPYSESSNFVEWLAKLSYQRAVVLLQKDFAEKLLAMPGDERYRAVSVISQISSSVKVVRTVTRESFDPPPKVTSVLVVVTPRRKLSAEEIHLVKMLFSQKRRKLASALKNLDLSLQPADPLLLSRRV